MVTSRRNEVPADVAGAGKCRVGKLFPSRRAMDSDVFSLSTFGALPDRFTCHAPSSFPTQQEESIDLKILQRRFSTA